MKIVALANESERAKIEKKTAGSNFECTWIDAVEAISSIDAVRAVFDFDFEPVKERIDQLRSTKAIVFVNSVSHTFEEIDRNFIRFNGWPGFFAGTLLELAAFSEEKKVVVSSLLDELGLKYCWVADVPGLVTPRVVAMIINEAYYTLGAGISTKKEIDTAMKLGTNYPHGPFEWSEEIGLGKVHELLQRLQSGGSVYEISEALLAELSRELHAKK